MPTGKILTTSHENRIDDRFGEEALSRAKICIEKYTKKWKLHDVKFIEFYSASLLFECIAPEFGPSILKIHMGINDLKREIKALSLFGLNYVCEVYRYSEESEICLLERITPGETLFHKTTRKERVGLFCNIHSQLHTSRIKTSSFPTYLECINESYRAISSRMDCEPISHLLHEAKEMVVSINYKYNQSFLLHGDLHHENILKNQFGGYTIVDPLGYVGDPIFDISRFVIVECKDLVSEPLENIIEILQMLSYKMSIPVRVLKECLFIETVIRLFYEKLRVGELLSNHEYLLRSVSVAKKINTL